MKRAEGEQEKLGPKDYLRERLRLGLTNSCSFSFTFPGRPYNFFPPTFVSQFHFLSFSFSFEKKKRRKKMVNWERHAGGGLAAGLYFTLSETTSS